jgi:hypothetical protein
MVFRIGQVQITGKTARLMTLGLLAGIGVTKLPFALLEFDSLS